MTTEEKIDKLMTDVAVIKNEIARFPKNFACANHDNTFQDHEDRLRILEDYKSKITGSLLAVSIGGSFIGVVLGLIISFYTR